MRELPTAEASRARLAATLMRLKAPTIRLEVDLNSLLWVMLLLVAGCLSNTQVAWIRCINRCSKAMDKGMQVTPIRRTARQDPSMINREFLSNQEALQAHTDCQIAELRMGRAMLAR